LQELAVGLSAVSNAGKDLIADAVLGGGGSRVDMLAHSANDTAFKDRKRRPETVVADGIIAYGRRNGLVGRNSTGGHP
jgi:hypothetical protein